MSVMGSGKKSKSVELIQPQAIAAWLVSNTSLTFEQIGDFCGIHSLNVATIGSADNNVMPLNPIGMYLTEEEIERCTKDPGASLQICKSILEELNIKKPRLKNYVPMLQKRNRLCGALWLVSIYPMLTDNQVASLVHSTPKTVAKVRNGSYEDMESLVPKSPIVIDLCTQKQIDDMLQ